MSQLAFCKMYKKIFADFKHPYELHGSFESATLNIIHKSADKSSILFMYWEEFNRVVVEACSQNPIYQKQMMACLDKHCPLDFSLVNQLIDKVSETFNESGFCKDGTTFVHHQKSWVDFTYKVIDETGSLVNRFDDIQWDFEHVSGKQVFCSTGIEFYDISKLKSKKTQLHRKSCTYVACLHIIIPTSDNSVNSYRVSLDARFPFIQVYDNEKYDIDGNYEEIDLENVSSSLRKEIISILMIQLKNFMDVNTKESDLLTMDKDSLTEYFLLTAMINI